MWVNGVYFTLNLGQFTHILFTTRPLVSTRYALLLSNRISFLFHTYVPGTSQTGTVLGKEVDFYMAWSLRTSMDTGF